MIPDHIPTDYPAEDWQRDPEPRNGRLPVAVALGAAAVLVLGAAWWLA